MNFLCYCSDFELSLKYDERYDYSNGVICLIGGTTHLAVCVGALKTKHSIYYAVFEWGDADFDNREANIIKANEISQSIIQFTNSTIESSQNRIMPLVKREKIQSALTYCRTNPIGMFKRRYEGFSIHMEETGINDISSWTIFVNDKQLATLSNKDAAKIVFDGLRESIWQYIVAWIKSLKR